MPSYFDHLSSDYRDKLTDIPNRRAFDERLIEVYYRSAGQFALLLLDIDGFKQINDTYGHPEGDKFLQATAEILASILRETDFLPARVGGDEFYIVLNNIDTEEKVKVVQERIRRTLDDYGIEVSIGGHVHQPDETMEDLVKVTDELMYADRYRRMKEKYSSPEDRRAAHELNRIT